MYVCVCQGITDHQIQAEITKLGTCSLRDLCERLGIAKHCGQCAPYAKALLEERQSSSN